MTYVVPDATWALWVDEIDSLSPKQRKRWKFKLDRSDGSSQTVYFVEKKTFFIQTISTNVSHVRLCLMAIASVKPNQQIPICSSEKHFTWIMIPSAISIMNRCEPHIQAIIAPVTTQSVFQLGLANPCVVKACVTRTILNITNRNRV